MRVEVITGREALEPLTGEWNALARRDARDGFFRTPGWYLAWLEHIRKDCGPYVITVREGEELVGLAPLCRGVYRDFGMRLPAVFWGGREVVSGDFLDVVAAPARRQEATTAVFGFLRSNQTDWGVLVLGELAEDGDSHRIVESMAREAGYSLRSQEHRTCPYIALPGSFEEYLGGLGSSTRYHIRRRMRDVEKLGGRVACHREAGEVLENLGTLIRLHLARWRKDDQPGTLGRPGFEGFLREVCARPPEGASVHLYVLSCQGEEAAALLAFHFGGSALYYQAGWDPDSPLAAHSPGVVLMAHSIRDAIESGLLYYEFLRGEEAYKSRWTATCRATVTVLAARSTLARQYLRVARLKDAVKDGVLNGDRARPAEKGRATAAD